MIISAQEASIGSADFATLPEAFAAAQEGETITVLKDLDVTQMIPVTKSVTLDLNGKTLTNNVTGNRMFRLSGVTFTIDGKNGSIITPETNTQSYGFVVFRDVNDVASPDAKLVASDMTFSGGTGGAQVFMLSGNGQTIDFTNVNVNLTKSQTWSIINGYERGVNINIKGGEFTYDSTVTNAGVFQCGDNSNVNFDGVKVNTTSGPIFRVPGEHTTGTFTNCDMTNTDTNGYFGACVAVSHGANVTVDGGTYTSNYPLYIYNTGGSLTVNGGEFNGGINSITADNAANANYESTVTVGGGTFTGPIRVDNRSKIEVADNSSMVETTNAEGKTVYIAAPLSSNIAAFVGTTSYPTLEDAFAAAEDGQKIVVFKDLDVTETTRLTKSVTLDLNGKTLTNNVQGNALFCISGAEFTIDGKSDIGDAVGKIVTPDTNTNSYGLVAFTVRGVTAPNTKLIATDVDFEGIVDNDCFFSFKANGQSIDFTNVNVNLKSSRAWSIINGCDFDNLNINLNGGSYSYDSTVKTAGVFQAGEGSTINFDAVTVNTTCGPIFEVWGSTAKFTDCTMTNTQADGIYGACIAPANGSQVTIDGGSYTSSTPLYIYSTGGTLNVEGGIFTGSEAAIQVTNQDGTAYPSAVNISDGTFTGPIKTTGTNSKIQISGGTYSEEPANEYIAQGYEAVKNPDGTFGIKVGTSTGIEDVEAAGTEAKDIYNLFGVRINGDVKNLPDGIYIIGGKKVLIRNR